METKEQIQEKIKEKISSYRSPSDAMQQSMVNDTCKWLLGTKTLTSQQRAEIATALLGDDYWLTKRSKT